MTIQRDTVWLKTASPNEIVAAQAAGELADVLGQPRPLDLSGQLTGAQVAELWKRGQAVDIERARLDGRLTDLLSGVSAQTSRDNT